MNRTRKGLASGLILETIFPGRCLVCGEWLLGRSDDSIPVCIECRSKIQPDTSAVTCRLCGTRLISEQGICRRCRESDFAFDTNTALFPYVGIIKELFQQLKFSGRVRLAPLFAHWAAAALAASHPGLSVIPVPTRPGRKSPQTVELIARRMEKLHGVDVRRILERAPGAQQKTLDFNQRKENLRGIQRGRAAG